MISHFSQKVAVGRRIEQLALVGIDSRDHSASRMSPLALATPENTPGKAEREVHHGAPWHDLARFFIKTHLGRNIEHPAMI